MIGRRLSDFALVYSGGHPGIFLRNGTVFRGPRTEWLQLEPVDSALALTRPGGLKVDDHFSTVYDVPVTRLAIIGGRARTHGTHRTRVLVYNPRARSSWSFGTCPFPQSFFHKSMCSMCSVCSHRENSQTWCVPLCVPMCSPEKGLVSFRPLFAPLAPPVGQTEHRSSPYDMSDPMPDYENVYTD